MILTHMILFGFLPGCGGEVAAEAAPEDLGMYAWDTPKPGRQVSTNRRLRDDEEVLLLM